MPSPVVFLLLYPQPNEQKALFAGAPKSGDSALGNSIMVICSAWFYGGCLPDL